MIRASGHDTLPASFMALSAILGPLRGIARMNVATLIELAETDPARYDRTVAAIQVETALERVRHGADRRQEGLSTIDRPSRATRPPEPRPHLPRRHSNRHAGPRLDARDIEIALRRARRRA